MLKFAHLEFASILGKMTTVPLSEKMPHLPPTLNFPKMYFDHFLATLLFEQCVMTVFTKIWYIFLDRE